MEVDFYNYTGADNVINKSLGSATTLNCNMQVATEQLNPHVRVTYDDSDAPSLFEYNYCAFNGYYYFIDTAHIINIAKGIYDVPMTLDVLMTYKDSILNSTAIIERSSSTYNMYLQDNMYSAYGYPLIGCREFAGGFNSSNYTYLLTTNTMKG